MARINLLPWREALRKQRQQEFLITTGFFAVVTLCGWGFVHFVNTQRIQYQESRNEFMSEQIQYLEKKIEEIAVLEAEKVKLKQRIAAIEQLQSNRPLVVRLFDEIVTSLPEGVSIISVKQSGSAITITGIAESNARVSSYMRRLDSSDWLAEPRLDVIQSQDQQGQRRSNFTMHFKQVIPSDEDSAS